MNIFSARRLLLLLIFVALASMPLAQSHGEQTDPIMIDFWHTQGQPGGWQPAFSPPMDYIWQAVDRFQADHPNVVINLSGHVNDAYKSEILTVLEEGRAPCVFPSWGGGPLAAMIEDGFIADLTQRMSAANYSDRFYPGSLDNVTYQGRIWGVPVEGISIAVIFYNKDVFARLGLVPPETLDELLSIVETLKQNGYLPFALANASGWPGSMHYMYLVDRLGGPAIFEAAATQTGGSFEDDVFIRAAELLQQMVDMGAFNSDANYRVFDDGDSRALLYPDIFELPPDPSSPVAVMELMGTWNLSILMKETFDYYHADPLHRVKKVGFFPYPRIEGGRGNPANLLGSVGDQYYHVAASCAQPDLAFEFIQYLIDDESAQVRIANGRIPPLRDQQLEDPYLAEIMALVEAAPHIQLWYDQELPPELGSRHLDIIKRLFARSITPQQAGREMQEAAVQYFQDVSP